MGAGFLIKISYCKQCDVTSQHLRLTKGPIKPNFWILSFHPTALPLTPWVTIPMNVQNMYLIDAFVVVSCPTFSIRRFMTERRTFSPTLFLVTVDLNFLPFVNSLLVSSDSSNGCKFWLMAAEFEFGLSKVEWMLEEFWRETEPVADIVLCRAKD